MKKSKSIEDIFSSMSVPQAVRTMAVPTVISQLIVLIYNMADTFYIGQTNNPYMVAGVSLVLPAFNLSVALGTLFGLGGGAVLPRLLALGDRDEAEKTAAYCVRMGAGVALTTSLLMLLFMRPVLNTLGANENTFPYARIYAMTVMVLGCVPTVLSNVLSNLLRSLGLSREAGVGVALGGVLNIFLDPLFMFVLLPKGNEVLGVAVATLISSGISCTYCLTAFFRRQKVIKAKLSSPMPKKENSRAVLNIGIPGSLGMVLFDLDYVVLDKLMSAYGETALAAIGIVLKVERLPQQIGVGLCQGMVPLVAYSHALKDYGKTKEVMRCTLKAGACVALISITVYELFAPYIMAFFINDPATLATGTVFLRIRTMAAVIMFFCFFAVFLNQGLGNGKRSSSLAVLRWLGLNIPMLFILDACFGMMGLVWAQVTSDVIMTIISFIVVHRDTRSWGKNTAQELH